MDSLDLKPKTSSSTSDHESAATWSLLLRVPGIPYLLNRLPKGPSTILLRAEQVFLDNLLTWTDGRQGMLEIKRQVMFRKAHNMKPMKKDELSIKPRRLFIENVESAARDLARVLPQSLLIAAASSSSSSSQSQSSHIEAIHVIAAAKVRMNELRDDIENEQRARIDAEETLEERELGADFTRKTRCHVNELENRLKSLRNMSKEAATIREQRRQAELVAAAYDCVSKQLMEEHEKRHELSKRAVLLENELVNVDTKHETQVSRRILYENDEEMSVRRQQKMKISDDGDACTKTAIVDVNAIDDDNDDDVDEDHNGNNLEQQRSCRN